MPRFKYEYLRTFKDIFGPDDWFFKFDYTSRYHQIDIYPDHWKYLAFCWRKGSNKQYYVFTVLLFGLATALLVFTKIRKALLKHWCGLSIFMFTCLDDGIGGHSSLQKARHVEKSGFVWHPEKSCWEPTQCDKVSGFIVNLAEGYFKVPKRRIVKLNRQLHHIQSSNFKTTAYDIAKLIGTIIAMGLALGPKARLWTRGLYCNFMSSASWSAIMELDNEAIKEIAFWRDIFMNAMGKRYG